MIHINKKTFHLQTQNLSYIISRTPNNKVGNTYFGKKISNNSLDHELSLLIKRADQATHFFNKYPDEYPTLDFGDFRVPAFKISNYENDLVNFEYSSSEIQKYSASLSGLPFAKNGKQSLVITLVDKVKGLQVKLFYTPFEECDVITRYALITNTSSTEIVIDKALSASFDLPTADYEILTLDGAWARERMINKRRASPGTFRVESREGVTSQTHQPFVALLAQNTTEERGSVYGATLIYSSNHEVNVNVSEYNETRVSLGINGETFRWKLAKPNSFFETPQAVLTYSDSGLSGMSQNFHNFVNKHILNGTQIDLVNRPVAVNNWEAYGFAINERKIQKYVRAAAQLPFEQFCLDDGWFGNRTDDFRSLGDWDPDKRRFPGGLKTLANYTRDQNLQFGIWMEPEMISPQSKLFKEHPDWAIYDPSYPLILGRNQLVLDLTNPAALEYVINAIKKTISDSGSKYLKWDMNRALGTVAKKENYHKQALAVYKIARVITEEFPQLVIEGCAAGGRRFDMGMLSFVHMMWTSDNTDAYERLKILYGTSLVFPFTTMTNHVSDVPNHQVGRTTELGTRNMVAFFGVYGSEQDITKLTSAEKKAMQKWIGEYHTHKKVILKGNLQRLSSPFEKNVCCWQVSYQKEHLQLYFKHDGRAHDTAHLTKFVNLQADTIYQVMVMSNSGDGTTQAYSGEFLMCIGIQIPDAIIGNGDNVAVLIKAVEA